MQIADPGDPLLVEQEGLGRYPPLVLRARDCRRNDRPGLPGLGALMRVAAMGGRGFDFRAGLGYTVH